MGTLAAFALGEPSASTLRQGGALMVAGVLVHMAENHGHVHTHAATTTGTTTTTTR
jgi:hypothetical protein